MCSTQSGVVEYLTTPVSDCVLWLVLILNLNNYFSVSGDSQQKKIFTQKKWYFDHNGGGGGRGRPLCGWHRPKVPLFLTPPLRITFLWTTPSNSAIFSVCWVGVFKVRLQQCISTQNRYFAAVFHCQVQQHSSHQHKALTHIFQLKRHSISAI